MALELSRIGFLYDEDDSTPHIPALLEFSETNGVRLQLPVAPGYGAEYTKWFRVDDACPRSLRFIDNEGALHLVNCRSAGFRGHLSGSHSKGLLAADYAIEDQDGHLQDFTTVDKVRSRIAGLHDFSGWQLSEVDIEPNADGTAREVVMRTTTPRSVVLGRIHSLEASLVPYWTTGVLGKNITSLAESTHFETVSQSPLPIDAHLQVHTRMRDFLALASWTALDFEGHEAQRLDSPQRVLSGDPVGPVWRQVLTNKTLRAHDGEDRADAMPLACPFRLETTTPVALSKWLSLGDGWSRATRPLLRLLFTGGNIETALLQSGVALEAWYFENEVASGRGRRAVGDTPFATRVRHCAETLPVNIAAMVGNLDNWVKRANWAYRAVKHADRPLPEPQEASVIAHTFILMCRLHLMRLAGFRDEVLATYGEYGEWRNLARIYAELGTYPPNPESR